MHSITEAIRRLSRLAATHELYAAGFSRAMLAAALGRHEIIRVRQGWYSLPEVHPLLLKAARVGGRLGCVSGARMHGMWEPPDEHLHVSVEHSACRLRTPADMRRRLAGDHREEVTVHWGGGATSTSRLLLTPLTCLEQAIRCQPVERAVAIADSALHQPELWIPPLVSLSEWRQLLESVPGRAAALQMADGVCETGTESLTRFRLAPHRLPLRPQVLIDDKRVDFLVGRALVVEVDGAKYHVDPERFEADRRRDAELSVLGYRVLRFSYNQVIYRWAEVEASILAAVIRGDHH